MCGIAGIVGPGAEHLSHEVEEMARVQTHRGPDGHGVWLGSGVALAHRRLRILDLSQKASQPMTSADGRFVVTYNGEVYNYREIKKALPEVSWRSTSDTEVILEAFARWGPSCVDRFVGMFAFAIWDIREHTLFCARDRFGIKPFFWSNCDGRFVFASEIRALAKAGVALSAEQSVIYDFLARDLYHHRPETFFAGIQRLEAGHSLWVRDSKVHVPRRYWNFADEIRSEPPRDAAEREERLLDQCREAVDLHLRSDVPVGVALSGGLDSSTLLSLLDQVHPNPSRVECFSFCFDEAAYSERPWVETMAAETGRRAHFVEITHRRFVKNVPKMVESQEEPFAGLPISAYAACFELARECGFIVLMDGSGLDECLGGYDRFRPARWADLDAAGDEAGFAREVAACGISAREARKRMHRLDEGLGQDLTRSARPDCLTEDLKRQAPYAPTWEEPFPDRLRNLMYRELRHTKLPRALAFRDRLSMSVGCELRPPFLDHRLVSYAFSLPPADHIDGTLSKAILRRATARFLPNVVRRASKRSVQTPQREWFRGPLASWVREHVDTPLFWQRGWVDPTRGKAALEAFLRGEGDNSFFLWQWINLNLWATQWGLP